MIDMESKMISSYLLPIFFNFTSKIFKTKEKKKRKNKELIDKKKTLGVGLEK